MRVRSACWRTIGNPCCLSGQGTLLDFRVVHVALNCARSVVGRQAYFCGGFGLFRRSFSRITDNSQLSQNIILHLLKIHFQFFINKKILIFPPLFSFGRVDRFVFSPLMSRMKFLKNFYQKAVELLTELLHKVYSN